MTPDQLEWQRRLRTGQIAGLLGGLLLSPGLALLSPLPFRFDVLFVINVIGLMVCVGLLAFSLLPGKFHDPTGIPRVPPGQTLINQNDQGGWCMGGCFGSILLCTLPYCVMTPCAWLALLGSMIFSRKRRQFGVFSSSERTLTGMTMWGGLQFRRPPRQILALVCIYLTDPHEDRTSHYVPALVFADGKIDHATRSFFRVESEQPVVAKVTQLMVEPKPVLDMLRAWGENKGIPVLAEPVQDVAPLQAAILNGGLQGLRLLEDWSPAPISPRSSEPPPALPPE